MFDSKYRKKLGRLGEQIAKRYYRRQGDIVVAENYYCRYGEIDLILLRGRELVFVEVKTRTSTGFGLPEEAVTEEKLEHMADTAEHWTEKVGYQGQYRFEIVAVIYKNKTVEVRIIEPMW